MHIRNKMSRESKFKVGMKVKSIINPVATYEVIEVLRNELKVKCLDEGFTDLQFSCKKSLFWICNCIECGEPLPKESEQIVKGYCNNGVCGTI